MSFTSLNDFREVRVDTSGITIYGDARGGSPGMVADPEPPLSLAAYIRKYGDVAWLTVVGYSMAGAGYWPGDLVIIAPSVTPRFGHAVAVRVANHAQPIVKKWTARGLYSVRLNGERIFEEKVKYENAEIIGVVVYHFADKFKVHEPDEVL